MSLVARHAPGSGDPIPARAGIGLRAGHYRDLAETLPDIGWIEVHGENYMGAGGSPRRWLAAFRERYPVSLHGIGLSLGTAGPLDTRHLARLAALADWIAPGLVSEHLSWSAANGAFLDDLLPLPYTEESLAVFAAHVAEMQDALGRRVLIENPSAYMRYTHSTIPEIEFLNAVCDRTGCRVLLDVNNAYVSALNLGFDPAAYLDAVPAERIGEIHLAGHRETDVDGRTLRIDDHGSRVRPEVWALYERVIERVGPIPTLIEWDSDLPALSVLLDEAARADRIMARAADARRTARARAG
jgi:hypothetical protein